MTLNLIYRCIYVLCGAASFVAGGAGIVSAVASSSTGGIDATPITIVTISMLLGLFTSIDAVRSRSLLVGWLINKTGNLIVSIVFMGVGIFAYLFLSYLEISTYLALASAAASLIASFTAQATFFVSSAYAIESVGVAESRV
jgi:hypothetical protein